MLFNQLEGIGSAPRRPSALGRPDGRRLSSDGRQPDEPNTARMSFSKNNPGGGFGLVFPRTNWAGNVSFGVRTVHQPESIDGLRRIVRGSSRIRALGYGHSFSGIADTAGDLVLLNGLPKNFTIDSGNFVGDGGCWHELHRAGRGVAWSGLRAARTWPRSRQVSIAGACATGTHGSGDDQCVLAASVAALQLVGPDGDLLELRRDADRDTFRGSMVALGALGIVTQLTLDIEPTYEMSQRVHLGASLDEIQDHLDDVFSAGSSVSAFTDWYSGEARVLVKRRVDQTASTLVPGRTAEHRVHPVPGGQQMCARSSWGLWGRGTSVCRTSGPTPLERRGMSCNQRSSCHAMLQLRRSPRSARSGASLRRRCSSARSVRSVRMTSG